MIFVTGSTGLLGTHLLHRLASEGKKVRAMHRNGAAFDEVESVFRFLGDKDLRLFSTIEWVEGDVTDIYSLLENMKGCKEVFHLAAVVSYHRKDRQRMYDVNVGGTANVVNTALHYKVDKFCHVSSIASFGRTHDGQRIDESTPWTDGNLHTHYGITKHLSDMEVWRAFQEGLMGVIVNPGFIVGPGSFDRSSPTVFKKIRRGVPYYPPGGTGMVGVSDVVRAMTGLMEKEITNEQYIAVGENLSFGELFREVSKELGYPIPTKEARPWMLQAMRIVEWTREKLTGKKAVITNESIKNSGLRFYYETGKIRKELNFQFQPVAKAIEETARYFREQSSH